MSDKDSHSFQTILDAISNDLPILKVKIEKIMLG